MACTGRCAGRSGCNCQMADGDCSTVSGFGSASQPFIVEPRVADCATNLLECIGPGGVSSDGECNQQGLYVREPEIQVDCGLSGNGQTGNPLTARVAPCATNQLECLGDGDTSEDGTCDDPGLFVPEPRMTVGCGILGDGRAVSPLQVRIAAGGDCDDNALTCVPATGGCGAGGLYVAGSTPGCGLRARTDGVTGTEVDTLFTGAGAHAAAGTEHNLGFGPNALCPSGDCDDFSGAAVYCDPAGNLRVPAYPRSVVASVDREPTVAGMFDFPMGNPATGGVGDSRDGNPQAFHELATSAATAALFNRSECQEMRVTVQALGRARIDLIPKDCWIPNYSLTASIVLGVIITGASLGNGSYITQRAQIDLTSNQGDMPGGCPTTDMWHNLAGRDPQIQKEAVNWTDFNTLPDITACPGDTVVATSFAGGIWRSVDDGGFLLRQWFINAPGIIMTGVTV